MIAPVLRRWVAFGSGVGIEIGGAGGAESLCIAAVRVRPNGARVCGVLNIGDFRNQPAAVWGTEYAAFAGKRGLRHVPATVLLPRGDVILRQLSLPGVSAKDLPAAVQFQMDGLHPYHEDDVLSGWARLDDGVTVLVAIVRRDIVERYITRFAEAGVKIGCFTCSAAVIHSALRLFGNPPGREILVSGFGEGGAEIYGESPAKPVFSAVLDADPERAAALAAAELRLETAAPPSPLPELLQADPPLAYAAALASACPRLSLPLNLLPVENRQTSSPLAWVPAAALGSLVLLAAGASVAFPKFENRRYLSELQAQIAEVRPAAERAAIVDRQIDAVRRRTLLLDRLRGRTKADMDALAEVTRLLPPPTWLTSLDLNDQQVTISGETGQPEPLIKVMDESPMFESSEFAAQPQRIASGWGFTIRTKRTGAGAAEGQR
jgi:Tfp pilus assembly protein PilN